MKFNKQTFEFEFVDTLTCFCAGGGEKTGGGGNNDDRDNNRGVERGRTNQPPASAGPANPSPRPQQTQDFNDDRASRGAPTPPPPSPHRQLQLRLHILMGETLVLDKIQLLLFLTVVLSSQLSKWKML